MADGRAKTPAERQAERAERRRSNARTRRAYRARQRERRAGSASDAAVASAAIEPEVARGPGRPRLRQGVVVSDKAPKTLVVRIDTTRQHRVYKKTVRESTTVHAHDERDEARAGDTVRVIESRPLSRTKRWRLVEIVERGR
ncbi:MAG TPA: 30S ribosomal protein S17 [Solirubrobacteraceae bacterium]|nr:30S ribosomal protein S17 [Solirubrobacteraceae bacterium]